MIRMSIPLYLGEREEKGGKINKGLWPYRKLSVIIALKLPSITFHPGQILLTPVPLSSSVETTLTLHAACYPRLVHKQIKLLGFCFFNLVLYLEQ